MTWLALAAMTLCHSQVQAKDWYVSNSGSDATSVNAGTSALPFKTLNRLTTLGKLASGDTINLACGSTWRETLTLNSNHSAGNLTIQSWPTGCANRPVINASVLLPAITWQAVTGKPYYSYKLSAAEAALITGNVEFVRNPANDAAPYFKARYPDPVSTGNNYALASSVDVNAGLLTMKSSDSAVVSSNDLTGADIHMRNQLWYVTSATVSGQSGGTLTVQGIPSSFAANDGYVLENKLWMLNKPGEWYFDKSTKTLYAANVSGTNVAPPTKLELTVNNNALVIRDIPNIKVVNLNVLSTVWQAIDVRNSPNPTVQNNLVQYGAMGAGGGCGDNAAIFVGPTLNINDNCKPFSTAAGSNGAIVSNNTIKASGYAGLNVISDSSWISGNIVEDTGTIARTRNVMYGLSATAPGGYVIKNTVTKSAYMGIAFSNKSKLIDGALAGEMVQNNTVSKFCLYYADCGGIYTYNANGAADEATPLTQGPSTVVNNAVFDAVGDYQGSHNPDRHLTVGVYLDNFTANVNINKNVLYKLGTGVLMNSGSSNVIDGNVIQGATGQGLLANDGGAGGRLKNNVVKNNVFHTFRRYLPQSGSLPLFQAGVAQNWYRPSDPDLLFSNQGNIVSNNAAVDAGGKPAQWRMRQNKVWPYSADVSLGKWLQLTQTGQFTPDSIKTPFRPKLTNITGTNLIANGDFSSGMNSWEINSVDASTTQVLDPQIANGCVGLCVKFVQNSGSPIQSSKFPLDSTGMYYFEYMAMGQTGSKSEAVIFNSTYGANGYLPDWDASNELGGPANADEVRWTERFFTPTGTDSASRFAVYSNAGKATYIDQVKLFKVATPVLATNLYDPTQYTTVLYNNGSATSTVQFACPFSAGCTGAVNQEGTALSFPISIAGGGRVLVYLKPSAWAR